MEFVVPLGDPLFTTAAVGAGPALAATSKAEKRIIKATWTKVRERVTFIVVESRRGRKSKECGQRREKEGETRWVIRYTKFLVP
jgi:hypothetical protein